MTVSPLLLAAAVGLAPAAPDPPGTRYYFLLFAGQSVPFQARTAHTWATWVRATPTAGRAVALDTQTISWLPADLDVRPLLLRTKVGKNWSLADTLAVMARNNARVSLWGPFETDAGRYYRAVEQARTLESGAVRFRSIDSLTRRPGVQHCVHAVTYADPVVRKYIQPVLRVGEPGTSRLAVKYQRAGAFQSDETHDWLIPALGLDAAGLVRREPGEPIPRDRR